MAEYAVDIHQLRYVGCDSALITSSCGSCFLQFNSGVRAVPLESTVSWFPAQASFKDWIPVDDL
jgi:hypothetical protein